MAWKNKRRCSIEGCINSAGDGVGRCKKHMKQVQTSYKSTRNAEENSFYSSKRWRTIRGYVLAAHPMCSVCIDEPAVLVHHIKPRDYTITDIDQERLENLTPLCSRCHNKIHKSFQTDDDDSDVI